MAAFEKGYVQVYTGDGKGKTTAALGLTLRAVAHGMKVYIAQFMKGQDYGELHAIRERLGDLVTVEQFGTPRFVKTGQISDEDYQLAQRALEKVKEALFDKDHRIVIMDEANVAMYMGLLDKKDWISSRASLKIRSSSSPAGMPLKRSSRLPIW